MKSLLLLTALIALPVFAQEKASEFTNHISSYAVSILELENIEVVEEHIDKKMVLDSYLVLEVTGTYESHGEEETVGVLLDRVDDGNPFNYESYEGKFYSIQNNVTEIGIGSSFITAISSPRKFKVRFRINVNGWSGNDDMAEWNLAFKYNKYSPVYHEVSRGINVMLFYSPDNYKWRTYKFGFQN